MTLGERIDRACEVGILVLVLAILAFSPLALGGVRMQEFVVIEGLTVGVLSLWLVRLWATRRPQMLWPPVAWAVLAAAAYTVVRYQLADIEYVARQECLRGLVYGALFLAVVNNLHRKQHVTVLRTALVLVGSGIAVYAIYQFATGSNKVWTFVRPAQYSGRASGTFICPNHLAGFLEMTLPLALAVISHGRTSALSRILAGYACLLLLAGIAVSVSRGAWLATATVVVIWVLALLRNKRHWIPALLVLLTLGLGSYRFAMQSITVQTRLGIGVASAPSDNTRIRLWLHQSALRMWLDHLWLGVGPGHFDYRFPAYRPVEIQAQPGRVHNDVLNLLTDWGLVGGILALGGLALLGFGAWRTWRYVSRVDGDPETRQGNRAALVLGGSLSLLAIGIHSFVDFNLHIPSNAILAVVVAAMLSAQLRHASKRCWIRLGWVSKSALSFLLVVAASCAAVQMVPQYREAKLLQLAQAEKQPSQTKVARLEAALAVEPNNAETTYALGECLRQLSWEGGQDYREQAESALIMFRRTLDLNEFDPYAHLRAGMCLDWLGRHNEALPFYQTAERLDPNNYYLLALVGWHHVQAEDYETATEYFKRSLSIRSWSNPIPRRYLEILRRRAAPAVNRPVQPAPGR